MGNNPSQDWTNVLAKPSFFAVLMIYWLWYTISIVPGQTQTRMKTTTINPPAEVSVDVKAFKHLELPKKRKNQVERLLHFLMRETDSDKRTSIFGADPFK